ncbi:MAG: NADH-quinone oxidoreductase subunit J [Elusimicrobiota bacterium]
MAFYVFAAVTLVAAVCVVLLRNVLHSALMLGLALAGVGGLFATLGADFLFAAQILIYVSGVAVLVLFVVMLSGRASELSLRQTNDQWLAALLICGVTLWGMWRYIAAFGEVRAGAPPEPTTASLGRILMGEFSVPFELASLILVAALVGAVVFTIPEPGGGPGEGEPR